MKKLLTILCAFVLGIGAYAANTATGSSTVLVVAPINITHNAGASLNFGEFANGETGSIVVSPTSDPTVTGINYHNPSNVAADSFNVTATAAGQSFAVTLPATATLTNAANSMTVDTFTATCTTSCSTTFPDPYVLRVGGKLTVASASQATGTYTGAYTVTLVY